MPPHRPRKYLALLSALLLLIVAYPILREAITGQALYDLFLMALFLTLLQNIFETAERRIAILLGVPTLLGLWTGYWLPGVPQSPLAVTFHALATLFLILTVYSILKDIYRSSVIEADSIRGALCGYLLMGIAFSHVYCILETIRPGAFQENGSIFSQHQTGNSIHFHLTYFSLVTLTTVGYGDILPANGIARSLAVLEAVLGQMYIAVLVSELVGKRLAQTPPPS